MAYTLRNAKGQFLKRSTLNHTREWVDNVDSASVWEKKGSAKNAAHAARGNGLKDDLYLQEVKLMLWSKWEPLDLKTKR